MQLPNIVFMLLALYDIKMKAEQVQIKLLFQWVAEHISKEKAFGSEANRKLARFDKDPNIPALLSSDNRGNFLSWIAVA